MIGRLIKYGLKIFLLKRKLYKPPIIIGGCARSGTSLLCIILSAHPKIYSLPYEQLVESFSSQAKIKRNWALLTFDDGYSQCFSTIRPILLKHKLPCIFFITTDFIDNKDMFYRNKISLCVERIEALGNLELKLLYSKINDCLHGQHIQDSASFVQWIKLMHFSQRDCFIDEICHILTVDVKQYIATHRPYLTSEEIKCLVSDGFTIGAHSKRHPQLRLLCDEEIEEEIAGSCKIIMDLTKEENVPFAFPFGTGINRRLLKDLTSKYKFVGLFFDASLQKNLKDEDFVINRIICDSHIPH